jgi:Zn finger protein HypA/HybF involved in hydrogenase expression
MPRKSGIDKTMDNREVITRAQIEPELIAMWGFNPYSILTEAPEIRRLENFVQWQCINCKHIFALNFVGLETLRKEKGYYCPKCHGTENPVNKSIFIDSEDEKKRNEKYQSSLLNESSIMAEIERQYGYQPYNFISINTGHSVMLEHKMCNSQFHATPAMLFDDSIFKDIYSGEDIKLPYCPKCNEIFKKEHKNYSGSIMIRNLKISFEEINAEMPYEFAEQDIYRFRSNNVSLDITCKYCHQKFNEKPSQLFAFNNRRSLCPHCHGAKNPVNKTDSIGSDKEKSASKMKGNNTTMTVKEIVDLADHDQLVGYPSDENVSWDKKRSKEFQKYLLDGYGFGLSFIFIHRPAGIYEVFDGKQRVSLLFQLLEKCNKQETVRIEKMECRVDILTDASIEELRALRKTLNMRASLNEPEGRKGAATSEKNEAVNKMLEHDFFKNCLIQGDKNDLADRDCVEILLAFCYDNFQDNADNRTLPSNLELFVAEKPPYDKESSYGKDPILTLDLMNHIFSNTDFICRAVDFCYMAVLNLCLDLGNRFREKNEDDYKTLYDEYVLMWSNLSPCVTLNPLAGGNMEKVQSYFKDMVLRIFDPEYVGI